MRPPTASLLLWLLSVIIRGCGNWLEQILQELETGVKDEDCSGSVEELTEVTVSFSMFKFDEVITEETLQWRVEEVLL